MEYELAIIGAGPAGYSAAIYAVRAGINVLVLDKGFGGGLAAVAPGIENYPGFISISGIDLVEKMKAHAEEYTKINFSEEVVDISKKDKQFLIKTNKAEYNVKAVLLAMGTEYRKLNVKGEAELTGKGVSYCATCDGFFFKDKTVAVIGGGNSALIESIFLKQIGCKQVYVIHRRDQLRAERSYQEEAVKVGVKIVYNTHVEKIIGTDKVESLEIHDVDSDKTSNLEVDGVFVSIGEEPQNKLAKKLGCRLDEKGFVVVDGQMRTSVQAVYAAGDVTGGLRQVVTACAKGAIAALASTEAVGKKYPY